MYNVELRCKFNYVCIFNFLSILFFNISIIMLLELKKFNLSFYINLVDWEFLGRDILI